jgi:hypothetical protein
VDVRGETVGSTGEKINEGRERARVKIRLSTNKALDCFLNCAFS